MILIGEVPPIATDEESTNVDVTLLRSEVNGVLAIAVRFVFRTTLHQEVYNIQVACTASQRKRGYVCVRRKRACRTGSLIDQDADTL